MTASAPPTVGFRLPHPELRPYVTSYYFADSAGPLHDNLHPEWGNVRLLLRGDWRIEKAGRMTPGACFGALWSDGPDCPIHDGDRGAAWHRPDTARLGAHDPKRR